MLRTHAVLFCSLVLFFCSGWRSPSPSFAGPTISWTEEAPTACQPFNRCPTGARVKAAYDGSTVYQTRATLAPGLGWWIDIPGLAPGHTASYIVSLFNLVGEASADPICVVGAGLYPIIAPPTLSGSLLLFGAAMPPNLTYQLVLDGSLVGTPTLDPVTLSYDSVGLTVGSHIFATNVCDQLAHCALSDPVTYVKQPPPIVYALQYTLDEGSGTVVHDSSGNRRDGIQTGATWVAGQRNTALQFNSTAKLVSGLTTIAPSRSFAVWTLRTGVGGGNYGRIFDKHTTGVESELFYIDEAVGVYRYANSTGGWSIPKPSANVWHHIAVVYDGTANTTVIYLDGIAQVTTKYSNGTKVTNADPYVFGDRGAGDRAWAGALDDICIANSVWSATTVANIKNGGC